MTTEPSEILRQSVVANVGDFAVEQFADLWLLNIKYLGNFLWGKLPMVNLFGGIDRFIERQFLLADD